MYTPMTFLHYNNQFTKKINDLYSQRGGHRSRMLPCLAILQGYNVSMYANPEDEDKNGLSCSVL